MRAQAARYGVFRTWREPANYFEVLLSLSDEMLAVTGFWPVVAEAWLLRQSLKSLWN